MEGFFTISQQKLNANSQPATNGECKDWLGRPNKCGYGSFRFKDPRGHPDALHKTVHVHRMALMVEIADLDVPASMQASHLCNRKLCINTKHISFESAAVNNARKSCFQVGFCDGHMSETGVRLPDCLVHLSE